MKGNGFDIEVIEEYVLDRLSPAKKALLEEAVTRDPLLRAEVEVQKETIQSIQTFRKAELKTRLNNIQVPANNWFSYSKIAASVLLVASATGALVYFASSNQQPENDKNVLSKEVVVAEEKVKTPNINSLPKESNIKKDIEPSVTTEETVSSIPTEAKDKDVSQPVKASENTTIAETREIQREEVVVPDFSGSFEDTGELDKNVVLPDDRVAQVTDTKAKIDVEIIDKSGKIQYQYYNNKLFLHGEFSSKPYEVLELNTHKGKQLYLFFEEKYYHLQPNTMEETSIEPINNPELKRQLEKIRVK